jgi:hypothetical protein
MQFEIGEAVQILEQTPAVLDALLRGKSQAWLNCRLDPASFSPIDVLGHLIFAEMTDWIPRARIILEHQDSRAFDPFDRRGFGPLIEGKQVEELLGQFAGLRSASLETLQAFALNGEKLDLPGLHPELGGVTLRQLIATWVVHDLGHIAQLMRIMASQYRDEIGPWRAFVSIVQ